jgi:hypothetical protein
MGKWNSAVGLLHIPSYIATFCSPTRHSLIAMESTLPEIPIYVLKTIHTEQQEHNFQHRIYVNVWCGIVGDQLIGSHVYVIPQHLTGDIYVVFL